MKKKRKNVEEEEDGHNLSLISLEQIAIRTIIAAPSHSFPITQIREKI